jgi:protein TonB
MFEQTFVDAPSGVKKPASLLLSVTVQLLLLCILIAIPVLYTRGLPSRVLKSFLVAPPVPHAAPPESARPPAQSARPQPRLLNIRQLISRPVVSRLLQVKTGVAPAPDIGVPGGTADASDSGIIGIIGSAPEGKAPPPTAAPVNKPKQVPLRVGGRTQEANLIRKVMPSYPPLAKAARVQGVVEFTALISKDGTIEHLQLVRGHPLFIEAAKQAVLQWQYRPTLLNGTPVEVVTDITVNFTLSQ